MYLQKADTAESGDESLLLELPVPFRISAGSIYVEAQAFQGLYRWLENFSRVSVCAPVVPDEHVLPSMSWTSANALVDTGRLTIHLLPWGYDPRDHFRQAGQVRSLFRSLIPQHHYLCFSNLGWFGAWGRIAAEEAWHMKKPYAVWLDWVLHKMPLEYESNVLKKSWKKTNRAMLTWSSLRDIRRASLGLFHGLSVYEAYAPYSHMPKLVHDIHLQKEDLISEQAFEERLAGDREKLVVLYVGRVHEMKGPKQWLDVIDTMIRSNIPGLPRIEAIWVGDGPLLQEMQSLVETKGLTSIVSFPGAETDRNKILEIFRAADLFMFCHLTPESPRCLIEALMAGVPILGFDSAYAKDLVSTHGGGCTVPTYDILALSQILGKYLCVKTDRNNLSRAALRSGQLFSEEEVFKHRADLIKEHL